MASETACLDETRAYTFRSLCEADREDIAELARHTYGGNDYIEGRFDEWLENKSQVLTLAAVCLGQEDSREHVVAIEVARLWDAKKTIYLFALRVHPDHRGKGLAGTLQSKLSCTALQLWPDAGRVRDVSHNDNVASIKIAAKCGMSKDLLCCSVFFKHEELTGVLESISAERERIAGGGHSDLTSIPTSLQRLSGTDGVSALCIRAEMYGGDHRILLDAWEAFDVDCRDLRPGLRVDVTECGLAAISSELTPDGRFEKQRNVTLLYSQNCRSVEALLQMCQLELTAARACDLGSVRIFAPLDFEPCLWKITPAATVGDHGDVQRSMLFPVLLHATRQDVLSMVSGQ